MPVKLNHWRAALITGSAAQKSPLAPTYLRNRAFKLFASDTFVNGRYYPHSGLVFMPSPLRGIKQCCDACVCSFVYPRPVAQKRCILGLWLLWDTNRKPVLEVKLTGSGRHEAVACAASGAFAGWLHYRYAARQREGTYRFAARWYVCLAVEFSVV